MKKIFPVIGGALLAFSCAGGGNSPLIINANICEYDTEEWEATLMCDPFNVSMGQEFVVNFDLSKLPDAFDDPSWGDLYYISFWCVDDECEPDDSFIAFARSKITSFKWGNDDMTFVHYSDPLEGNNVYLYGHIWDWGEQIIFKRDNNYSKDDVITISGVANDDYNNIIVTWNMYFNP